MNSVLPIIGLVFGLISVFALMVPAIHHDFVWQSLLPVADGAIIAYHIGKIKGE